MSKRFCGSRLLSALPTTATLAIVATVALAAQTLVAQSPANVTGTVTTETGVALIGADVAVGGTQLRATTDERGEFRLPGVPAGNMEVKARRLGFRPDAVRINVGESGTEHVSLKLAVATQELQPVVVHGQAVKYTGRLAGYYERLEHGVSGVFITRDQIERENPRSIKQLLRRTPGITGLRERDGSAAERIRGTNCAPLLWLDGNAMPNGQVDLDTIEPTTLEGIEIYLGATGVPARYTWSRDQYFCGAILLWTRGYESDVPHQTITSPTEIEALVASLSVFTADQVDKTAALDSARPLVIPYPPSLYAAHTRGTVVAEFVVDGDGHVEPGTLGIVSSTNPLFSEAVRRTVGGASFIPALRAGKAVRQLVQQPFEFTGVK
jgi:TonB family protein